MPADAERAGLESSIGASLARFVLVVSRHRRLVLSFSVVLFVASLGITILLPALLELGLLRRLRGVPSS